MKQFALIMAFLGLSLGAGAQQLPGTKVTLNLKDATLNEVAEALSKTSGNPTRISFDETGLKRVTLEAKDQEYWKVILGLCEKNGLQFGMDYAYRGISLTPGDINPAPTSAIGGALVRITRAKLTGNDSFRNDPSRVLELELQVRTEPKAGLFKISKEPADVTALTPQGKKLKVQSGASETMMDYVHTSSGMPRMRTATYSPPCRLAINAEAGLEKIQTLSGKIWGIQETQTEDWVIDDLSKAPGMKKTCCDIDEIKIVSAKASKFTVELEIEVTTLPGQTEPLVTADMLMNRMEYEFGPEKPNLSIYLSSSAERKEDGKTIRKFTLSSDAIGDPTKLTLHLPKQLKAVQIPFEFQNVDLP